MMQSKRFPNMETLNNSSLTIQKLDWLLGMEPKTRMMYLGKWNAEKTLVMGART